MAQTIFRKLMAVAFFTMVAACRGDVADPGILPDDEPSDFAVGVVADQAGLPGLMSASRGIPLTDGCAFNEASGRIECAPVERNGLTFVRSLQLLDADGVPQSQRGANVVAVNTKIDVDGTVIHDNGQLTVNRSSDLTVTGLGAGSNTLTHNGAENGTISGTRTHAIHGQVTTSETFSHTTVNVVIPRRPAFGFRPRSDEPAFPLSGTAARSVEVTRTIVSSGEIHQFSHSEVITFNGTGIVPVVLTRNGETRNCTRNLVTRRLHCG